MGAGWFVARSKADEWPREDSNESLVVVLIVVEALCVPLQMSQTLMQMWMIASRLLRLAVRVKGGCK